ncbi:MAG: arginine--tRNA ligase [Gammaproteobacteria bacterium]
MVELVQRALLAADLPAVAGVQVHVERTRDPSHGDFATNVALVLAKPAGMPPRALAERIRAALPADRAVTRTEIAGPGFINFFLAPEAAAGVVLEVLERGERYGASDLGAGRRLQVEYVSANPTGPLHVGHGRGAAYGSVLSALLVEIGYDVQKEYYVNDAGRQVDILGISVWLRYLEDNGAVLEFPARAYQGDYVRARARDLAAAVGTRCVRDVAEVFAGVPRPVHSGTEEEIENSHEAELDGLIAAARRLLGIDFDAMIANVLERQLGEIRAVLDKFRVGFDRWYSERALHGSGLIEQAIAALERGGHLYGKDGALWFRSTAFGDDKDRVIRRENGAYTYFASDIAYHHDKFGRGFDAVIDVWGADHHGYIPRVRAALTALGHDAAKLDVPLMQLVALFRGGEPVRMGKRSGSFVTLEELVDEVGVDAARFFYVARKADQHFEFDLDLAKSQSADNPVYYVQMAHARVCSVWRQLAERGLTWDAVNARANLGRLVEREEHALLATLERYPTVVRSAALDREPHQLAQYVRELATDLHACYNAHKFIVDDSALRDARLALVAAVRQVLANGLRLLGVTAPESM